MLVACSSTSNSVDEPVTDEDGFAAFNEAQPTGQVSDSYLPEEKEALGMPNSGGSKIITKSYDVTVVRQSRSGRIYLLENKTEVLPQPGKVILLKDQNQPAMGFRILKTYPHSREIAAKKIRTYPGHDVLESRAQFRAFEKIGDVEPVVPIISDKDQQDIDELENLEKVEKADALPAAEPAIEPAPPSAPQGDSAGFEAFPEESAGFEAFQPLEEGKKKSAPEELVETQVEEQAPPPPSKQRDVRRQQDLEVVEDEEKYPKEYYPHRVTLDIGMIRAPTLPVGSSYGMSAGILYSKKVISRFLSARDSIALEGGVSFYKMAGDTTDELGAEVSKSFTVIPLRGTIRYDRPVSENIDFYLYGGLHYHRVASDLGATEEELAAANTTTPALGIGFFLQTGPNWFLRLNLGLDSIALGIALKF